MGEDIQTHVIAASVETARRAEHWEIAETVIPFFSHVNDTRSNHLVVNRIANLPARFATIHDSPTTSDGLILRCLIKSKRSESGVVSATVVMHSWQTGAPSRVRRWAGFVQNKQGSFCIVRSSMRSRYARMIEKQGLTTIPIHASRKCSTCGCGIRMADSKSMGAMCGFRSCIRFRESRR